MLLEEAGGGYASGQAKGGIGGSAGGLTGYSGVNYATSYGYAQYYIGTGANQVEGGKSISGSSTLDSGKFGKGGSYSSEGINNGGGGSGYYGGGSASRGHGASGGGSSYISGHTGCVAITSSTDTSTKKIDGSAGTTGTTNNAFSIHYSGLYFTDTTITIGLIQKEIMLDKFNQMVQRQKVILEMDM